ncbi:uncharacterized protein LOC127751362 [Frankliniella occidentalis]|uniref:Uncharacterized protein LOC127751362 n=1 Tax=Frankliniella occidentalis TaxID=133901 RepID=A0A9C6X7W6_FRAOC|nr:uncharacterized protein LOC127751362 [Frankliniella occidentalis]
MSSLNIAPIGDRCFTTLRKLVAVAALPSTHIQEAINILRPHSEGTMYSPLLGRVQSVWIDGGGPEWFSCSNTRAGCDAALLHLATLLMKELTTGHPRPTAWQFIVGMRNADFKVKVAADNNGPRRARPNLRADVQGTFLRNLVTQVQSDALPLPSFMDRGEVVLKAMVKGCQAITFMRGNHNNAAAPPVAPAAVPMQAAVPQADAPVPAAGLQPAPHQAAAAVAPMDLPVQQAAPVPAAGLELAPHHAPAAVAPMDLVTVEQGWWHTKGLNSWKMIKRARRLFIYTLAYITDVANKAPGPFANYIHKCKVTLARKGYRTPPSITSIQNDDKREELLLKLFKKVTSDTPLPYFLHNEMHCYHLDFLTEALFTAMRE